MKPDDIIIETMVELVRGKATVADVQAAIALAFELPGWEGRDDERKLLEHYMVCDRCVRRQANEIRADVFMQRLANEFGARVVRIDLGGGAPTDDPITEHPVAKGVH